MYWNMGMEWDATGRRAARKFIAAHGVLQAALSVPQAACYDGRSLDAGIVLVGASHDRITHVDLGGDPPVWWSHYCTGWNESVQRFMQGFDGWREEPSSSRLTYAELEFMLSPRGVELRALRDAQPELEVIYDRGVFLYRDDPARGYCMVRGTNSSPRLEAELNLRRKEA